jgi:uncharacterized phage-like protein YoqJ
MVLAFSGHRPERLPWGEDESDPRCAALRVLMRRGLERAAAAGYTDFLCGMARGCDFYFAEEVLALRGDLPELRLTAVLPCPSQPDAWREADRARYRALLGRCAEVRVLEPVYSEGCMLRRNRWMVGRADALMTVYDGGGGGTAQAVRCAERRGVPVFPIWL